MAKEMVCIICPRGCHLKIDDNNNVSGNNCIRGVKYALSELTNPVRTITTSVRVSNREDVLVSVKTTSPIPKNKIFEVMEEINKHNVKAPVRIGDVVIKNVLGLDSDIVITKNID